MEMDFKALLRKSEFKPALIIGNGVNLFNTSNGASDWQQLLLQLWRNRIGDVDKEALEGISLTNSTTRST